MAAPKYVLSTSSLYACLQNAEGVPEAVPVTLTTGESSIVWNRDNRTFSYDCIVNGRSVRVLEEALGVQSAVQSMVNHLRDPQGSAELRLARSALAHVPTGNAPPPREGPVGGAPSPGHDQMAAGSGDQRGPQSAEADVPCPMQV